MLSFICVHENFVNFVREHVLPAKGDDFMELKPIGVSNRLFYYLNGGENSAFDACFRFDFKEETQEELLSAAIAKALQSFPEFAFRPVLHEGTVWAAKNEAPVPLLHEEAAPLCYGTEETNGYIFAFRALKKGFVFSNFHGLSDFYGTWIFLNTVLYHYALGKGLAAQPFEGIRLTPDAAMGEMEQLDPYRYFREESPKTEMPAAFAIPETPYAPEDPRCASYELRCPLKDFLAAAKAHKASAGAFLALTAAKAVDALYEAGDEPIVVMMPADMRQCYQTRTMVNFSDATFLRYDEKLKKLPPEEQGAAFKQQLKSQVNREHFAPLIAEKTAAIDGFVHSGMHISQWNQRLSLPPEGPSPLTIPVTYPGRLDLPAEYRAFVENVDNQLYFRGMGTFGILGTTYGDTVHIRSSQRFDSPALMQEMSRELAKAGLSATFHQLPSYQGNQLITKKLQEV